MDIRVLLFFLIIGVWLIGISVVLFRMVALFNRLTRNVNSGDLKKVLDSILSKEEKNSEEIKSITKRITFLEGDGRLHVQKIGLIRFNPFKELGGDHSFSLAVLDGKDNGVIITSLHTRDRTRVYMKEIKSGKSDSELSTEERRALEKAKK